MKKMTEERLVELRARATDVRWMMGDSAPEMQEEEDAVGLADAVEEIDRLQEEVGALILAARMEVAKNEDLLAENERLTAALKRIDQQDFDHHCRGDRHSGGCYRVIAYDALNPTVS
jgi:uncharacterized membrane protein YccC